MNQKAWFLLFLLILIGDLAGIHFNNDWLQYACKPLIVPVAAAAFLSGAGRGRDPLKLWILSALFFSWAGDILLMFDEGNELFFLLGLSSFLIAHLFYILFFHKIRIREKLKNNPWVLLAVAAYYTTLILLLADHLGDMEWPVRIYGVVISLMLLLALHMGRLADRSAGNMMMGGAILFVISDSVLALNKFYYPFEGAGLLVMTTYAFAQWLLVQGASHYTRHAQKI